MPVLVTADFIVAVHGFLPQEGALPHYRQKVIDALKKDLLSLTSQPAGPDVPQSLSIFLGLREVFSTRDLSDLAEKFFSLPEKLLITKKGNSEEPSVWYSTLLLLLTSLKAGKKAQADDGAALRLTLTPRSLQQMFHLATLHPSPHLDLILLRVLRPFDVLAGIPFQTLQIVEPGSVVDPTLLVSAEFFQFCLENPNRERLLMVSTLMSNNSHLRKKSLQYLAAHPKAVIGKILWFDKDQHATKRKRTFIFLLIIDG